MSVSRVLKYKNQISVSKLEILYKNFATRDTKYEPTIVGTEITAATIPPAKITGSGIQELVTENDVFIKSNTLFQPSEKEILGTTVNFEEVPGPKLLQHIARGWNFIPVFGNQVTTSTIQYMLSANHLLGSRLSWGRNAFIFRWMMNEYGPVVRLQGPFGGNIVVLSRAEDALSIFASEGRYPIRSSLDCIEKYRMEYRKFKHAGPFLMFGEDWEKLRQQIIDTLKKSAPCQYKSVDIACDQFITKINKMKTKQEEVPVTFWEELCKWSLECLCSVILGQKLGFLTDKTNVSASESLRLFNAFSGATDAVRRCESGFHLWKFIKTPAWKSLVTNCDSIDNIFGKYLREAEDNLRTKKQDTLTGVTNNDISLLEAMLLQEEMLPEDILTVFMDMMLIGVNAVTHSSAFLFYHLARCPRAQRILYDEIKSSPDQITAETLSKMVYLKACISESLRLKPPIPFLSRVLTKDTVVSSYRIPKGTVILMATYLSSIQEENFDDALKFIPERWLNTETNSNFLSCFPFGYGPKACLARNLAEMQLSTLIIKILRNYKIQYHYGDINSNNRLLAYPDKPLKFRFSNRNFM